MNFGRPRLIRECRNCGKKYSHRYRKTCSPECASRRNAVGITAFNKSEAGRDLKRGDKNPMRNPATRKKVSESHKASGHMPKLQGGNGRGPTKQEKALADRLGWDTNVIVTTGSSRPPGSPKHYKIDVASREHMVAVEIDGRSHRTIKVQDADRRKSDFLISRGWKVLRFTNQQVTEHLEECARTVMSTTSK